MVQSDIVDHLHHDDCLADAGASKHSHFAASGKRDEKVNYLDPGFQNVDGGVLFKECGCLTMNRHGMFRIDRTESVDRPTHHVQDPPETFRPDGHADRPPEVLGLHPANQTIGDVHGDATYDVVSQVLGNLHDQIVLDVIDRGIGDGDCVHDSGELSLLERDVDDRSDDLYKPSNVHTRLLQ